MADINKILSNLGLTQDNSGTWTATGGWRKSAGGKVIESINPATGQVIAKVHCTTEADYEQVMKDAEAAFKVWRDVPAPKRGEAVRLVGDRVADLSGVIGFGVPGAGLRQAAQAFVIDNGPIGGRVGRTMTLAEVFVSIKY